MAIPLPLNPIEPLFVTFAAPSTKIPIDPDPVAEIVPEFKIVLVAELEVAPDLK